MSNLILGTAQLGMNYGVVNYTGQPSEELALAMLRHAIAQGVSTIDTARDYGTAEALLGQLHSRESQRQVTVVTKLDPLRDIPADARGDVVCAAVENSVLRSCQALHVECLDALLLHRWEHRAKWNGAVWSRLLELKGKGKIRVLGASVYEPVEAIEALRDQAVQHLQIPFNLLDWRWRAAGVDKAIASRPDVVVHARSALLQGILIHGPELWPSVETFDANKCAETMNSLVTRLYRESVADLCFAYVRSQDWIHGVVVGCENMSQLDENLKLFQLPTLDVAQCAQIERSLPRVPESVLNPAKWKNTIQLQAVCNP